MQRAHLQQPAHPGRLHRLEHAFGQGHEHPLEPAAVVAALVEDAREVDHRVGAGERIGEEARVVDVAAPQFGAGRQPRALGPAAAAAGYHDPGAILEQLFGKLPADEAGTAEDHHVPRVHAASLRPAGIMPGSRSACAARRCVPACGR
jgi:hypothetical protein